MTNNNTVADGYALVKALKDETREKATNALYALVYAKEVAARANSNVSAATAVAATAAATAATAAGAYAAYCSSRGLPSHAPQNSYTEHS